MPQKIWRDFATKLKTMPPLGHFRKLFGHFLTKSGIFVPFQPFWLIFGSLLSGTSVVYEEEKIAREDLARLCHKAENDANFWRLKYEQDGVAKIEELEYTKLKLQARFVKKYLYFD